MQHFQHVVRQFQRGAGFGDGLQELYDQAIQGLWAVGRQVPAHGAIERADGCRGIDDEAAVGLRVHVLVHHRRRIRGEFTDDFLEYVLERDQALNIAVFVDDECHAALVALKIHQLRIERRARRHEIRLARAGRFDQCLAIQPSARKLVNDLLHVQHADDAIDFPLINRQARVLALTQLLDGPVPIIVDIDADDLVARHHDVLHGGVFQIQNADQHLLVPMRNHRAGFRHDRAQFFAAQGIRGLLRRHAEQAQHAVRHQVRGPHERIQHLQQGRVDVGGRQREPLGVQGAERLGRHFAEDQQHQCQRRGPESNQEFAAQSQGDEAHQHRRRHIDDGAEQ